MYKKTIMRLLSILIASAMMFAMLPTGMIASAEVVSSGTCGEDLTWTLDETGLLTISGTGNMYNYSWNESNKAPWGAGVKSVNMMTGVTSIGAYAFYGCADITEITIPEGITRIDEGAFSRCAALTSVIIPESVMVIGSLAFYRCSRLRSIKIERAHV